MSEIMSMRFDKSRYSVVEFLAKETHTPKSEAVRQVFDLGRIAVAAKLYQEGKASLEKAAKLSGMSVGGFMDELSKRHIESNISLEDFKESLKTVKRMIK